MDPHFRVEVVSQTPNPQRVIWLSQHQCVCEAVAIDAAVPSEAKCGEYVVKHLLNGGRGHWSPFEAPQISFQVSGWNHRIMQQVTRHRIGVHFSVQSLRYTGDRFAALGKSSLDNPDDSLVEETEALYYLRPVGTYSDRKTGSYEYTELQRRQDLQYCTQNAVQYYQAIAAGKSHEQAAGMLLMDVRQNWVMSFNVRSLCHFLDLRATAVAQSEAQDLCDAIVPHFKAWVPAIADWYMKNRWKKPRLAP